MKELLIITIELLKEVKELKVQLLLNENPITKDWIPRDLVMSYLGYQDTQMGAIEKKYKLVVAKVGKRKFYHRESIKQMLDAAII